MEVEDIKKRLGAYPSPWDSKRLNYIVRLPTVTEVAALPEEYDGLKPYQSAGEYDQGDVGSCVGWSGSIHMEIMDRLRNAHVDDLSAGFLYVKSREYANIVDDSEDGSTILGGCKSLNKEGCVTESCFPTDVSSPFDYNQQPCGNYQAEMSKHSVDAYYQVPCYSDALKAAIYGITHLMPYKMADGSDGKTPLWVAIPVYRGFMDAANGNGVVDPPEFGDQILGYHAVAFRGWKKIGNKFYWIISNSWGRTGDNGSYYLDFDHPIAEAWILHLGNIPPPPEPEKSWWEKFLEWFFGLFKFR